MLFFDVSISRRPAKVKLADQQQVIYTVEAARFILGQYIEPGPQDAAATVNRLLAITDDDAFIAAVDRLKGRQTLRLVEGQAMAMQSDYSILTYRQLPGLWRAAVSR